MYFIARSRDLNWRIYSWNIQNYLRSIIGYADAWDQSNNKACCPLHHESDIQLFFIGPDLYSASHQHRTLMRRLHDEEMFQPVELFFESPQEVLFHYQAICPTWPPSRLTPHDPAGDVLLPSYGPDTNHTQQLRDISRQALPADEVTTPLTVAFRHGITNVADAAPTPGSPEQALEPSLLIPNSDYPQGPWFMKLPERPQSEDQLKDYSQMLEKELKKLGHRRVECSYTDRCQLHDIKSSTILVSVKVVLYRRLSDNPIHISAIFAHILVLKVSSWNACPFLLV